MNNKLNSFLGPLSAAIKKTPILWMGLYVVIVSALIMIVWKSWNYDDPFITYRYASNLANGVGFVYNPGERMLSTTTPLFTLLLAGIALFWDNIPLAAKLLGATGIAFGAAFIFDTASSLKSPLVGWVALILYPSSIMVLMTIGSETPLYIAFAMAAFAVYYRQNYLLTAVFSALVLLTRPDGALIPAILALDFLLRKGKPIPWKAVAFILALVAPWFAFSWLYFGSPFPSTLFTKHQQGVMQVSRNFLEGVYFTWKGLLAHWYNWLGLGSAITGLYYACLYSRRWLVFISWPLLYAFTYILLGVAVSFWYYAPLIPGYVALIGLGLIAIHKALAFFLNRDPLKTGLTVILPVAVVATILMSLTITQVSTAIRASRRNDERYLIYREIGNWLSNNTPKDATISMLEVGIIGYYAQRAVIDFAGLIQVETAKQMTHTKNYNDTAIFAVEHYKPQYLVLLDNQLPKLEGVVVTHLCTPVKHFKGAEHGSSLNMTVYTCMYP